MTNLRGLTSLTLKFKVSPEKTASIRENTNLTNLTNLFCLYVYACATHMQPSRLARTHVYVREVKKVSRLVVSFHNVFRGGEK